MRTNRIHTNYRLFAFAVLIEIQSTMAGRWLSNHNCGSSIRELSLLEVESKDIENDYDFAKDYLTRGLEYGSPAAIQFVCRNYCNELSLRKDDVTCCYGQTFKGMMSCGGYDTTKTS